MTRRVVMLTVVVFIALLPLIGSAAAQDPYPPEAPAGGETIEQREGGLGGGGEDQGLTAQEILVYVTVALAAGGTIAAGVWGVKQLRARP